MTTVLPDLPLNDPAFYTSDRAETYRILRDDHPVYWCRSGGFWTLTRYEDVLAASKDPITFCNGQGMTMRGGELADVPAGETLITLDAPKHALQRRLVNRSFSQRSVAVLEPRVRAVASELVDNVPAGEPVDFVEAVAAVLPVVVIAELLGVPIQDREKFIAWSNASIGVADDEYANIELDSAVNQWEYFAGMLETRRSQPEDDLLSVIIGAADEAGTDLTYSEAVTLCVLLLAAGNETTRNLITHGVIALSKNPEELTKLRNGSDMAVAIEELLRYVSPVIHMARTLTCDTELRGQALREGDQVVMLYGAANHDEREFGPSADELVIDREHNPHLAFGFGPHFCLGAALARLEARVLFDELVGRFSRWTVTGAVDPLRSTMVRGIKHLPVVLDP